MVRALDQGQARERQKHHQGKDLELVPGANRHNHINLRHSPPDVMNRKLSPRLHRKLQLEHIVTVYRQAIVVQALACFSSLSAPLAAD